MGFSQTVRLTCCCKYTASLILTAWSRFKIKRKFGNCTRDDGETDLLLEDCSSGTDEDGDIIVTRRRPSEADEADDFITVG